MVLCDGCDDNQILAARDGSYDLYGNDYDPLRDPNPLLQLCLLLKFLLPHFQKQRKPYLNLLMRVRSRAPDQQQQQLHIVKVWPLVPDLRLVAVGGETNSEYVTLSALQLPRSSLDGSSSECRSCGVFVCDRAARANAQKTCEIQRAAAGHDGQSGCYYDEVRSAARRGAATEARRTMGKKGAKRKTRWRTLSIGKCKYK
uniref:Uncharacterized protein n=1 Tax=Trichogramma brassicae TaxID=86971 RepID=A0A6H5IM04_9HYME|nr:unnamed protein product [Trichogramma brassicae]